ncbi:MAG: PstS family phosphate ABC transporter substrate-binding protein [Anaerovoracaceae bacterium]
MFKKKSKDAEGEENSKKKKKKQKKPKLTPREKAVKNKAKVEKQANAKVKKADAKIKKAEQAVKNKEKKAEKKVKQQEKKEAKLIQAEEKKQKKKEEKKEKKAAAKIRKSEAKAEARAAKMQKKAELAARTPIQKKLDRRRKLKKFLLVLILIAIAAGLVFAGIKFGPKLIAKIDLPDLHIKETISETVGNIKEKIPFLNKSEEDGQEEEFEEEEEPAQEEEEPPVEDDTTLYISGTSVMEDFYTEALAEFLGLSKKEVKEQVSVASTSQAYTNLVNGDNQVIFSAFPTAKETKMAELAGVDLQPVPIANGGFVFFVSKDNPVKSLTVTQLYNIYCGTITNWKELGGKNEPIMAFQRSENSGSQAGMYKYVISESEISKVSDDMKIESTKDIVKAVEENSGAIGYSYYYYIDKLKNTDGIKMIPVNGVAPNKKNIASAKYPLTTYSYAIIATEENTQSLSDIISAVDDKIDKMQGETAEDGQGEGEAAAEPEKLPLKQEFIKWILSDEGQALLEKHGFIRHDD